MILVTGGAGYIGSHTCIELIEAGYNLIVYDNFSNSNSESLNRVEEIVKKSIIIEEGDIRNSVRLKEVFSKYKIDSVIHFAGLKAIGESVDEPLKYYDNNLNGTFVLLAVMKEFSCKKIVFSSSATVYGDPVSVPISEDFDLSATNPYGRSKLFIEEILRDMYFSDNTWQIILLRYFNPVGAHKSGLIGENPNGIPNNLMPFISQVAVGKRECLSVFGGDYDTKDGSGERDYIHVCDLALGHVQAIKKIDEVKEVTAINLGTGKAYTVLEIIKAFEKASSTKIPFKIVSRRSGDIASCYSNPSKALEVLGWSASRGINEMCADSWNWQLNNPNGYNSL